MYSNFLAYLRSCYRVVIPTLALFAIAIALPPFSLFEDRAASMLQLHLLLELFAVIVAILIATISWHDQSDGMKPQSGIFLAGFSIVAIMDLVHALTYDGMPRLIIENSTHRAIFFWLAGRTFVALTLLLFALRIRPVLPRWIWLIIALLVSSATFWIGTFGLDLVPNTFVPGLGVTIFKRNYEYFLFGADVFLFLLFIYRATSQNQRQFFAFANACLVMALGEIVFSDYTAPSDFLNNLGHVFKVASYAFLYQSIFVAAIRQPYEQAKRSEARFRGLTELSSDWYWEQDVDFRFTLMSTGISKTRVESFIGKARWELPIEGVSAEQWDAHRKTLQRHEPFSDFEYQIRGEADHLRSFSVSGFPIFNDKWEFLGYRGIGSDITERQANAKQIEQLAYHDALTGLPNRILIQDRFEQAAAYASRANARVAVLYMDLDNFKGINDSLGHDAGDALLKEVAARISSCVRDTDTISRQGGDEFLIIQPDVAQTNDVAAFLDKITGILQEPFHVAGNELSTSASIGVAIFPQDGHDFDTLRKKADMAMYQAKAAGRNTYRFFAEAMNAEAMDNVFMRNGLRRALEQNEFILHYQPQIDLASGAVVGVEALIRWNHPELGMVAPGRFIPVSEESGLIVPIGAWVLREACRQAMEWKQSGLPEMTMAVNLSAVQFRRGDLEQSVVNALEASGLDPALLELELTESILIQNVETVLASVRRLKQLGVKLSIDDFGTGYSSLSYLKRFDIDKLKIDQSFIRDLATDPNDAAIVRAIIQMAHSLNLKTVAEGVETIEMVQQLRTFQCDEAQGYHYARPMPASQMARFLADRDSP